MATLPVLVGSDEDWTPSNYMPDVRVEIAFTSTYITPAADRVWTDVSEWVELHEGIDIDIGRGDELSVADANTLTLTLDNKDGRFTAFRAASPYYPNVKVGRPVRVSVLTQTGHTSVRFVGFIDGWPVEWDGSDAYAKAKIGATSRMSRLGLTTKLRSMLENEILTAAPVAYWTLGDPAGSAQASESSGNGASPLTITGSGDALVFGTALGPATDGLTAAQFSWTLGPGGEYLTAPAVNSLATPIALRATIKVDALPPNLAYVVRIGTGTDFGFSIRVDSAGLVKGPNTVGPNINDGATHDVVLVDDGADELLYVDGALVDSDSLGGAGAAVEALRVGHGLDGVVSHVAVYNTVPTPAQIAAQALAALTGFGGERTDQRLVRTLDWMGVAATEVNAETGVENMTHQFTDGMSVVDALRECESTEGGVLFDGPDGRIVFHNRAHRYQAGAAVTLDMASQHVEADYAPRLDRSKLINDATVNNPTTSESARVVDTASIDEYGVTTGSATSVAYTSDPLRQKASWLVASYAEPRIRVPSLTVDVLAHVGLTPSAEGLLDVTVGDLLTVEGMPSQAPFPGGDWLLGGGTLGEVLLGDAPAGHLFVEGYAETIGAESYRITYNLSPSYPTLSTVILDDPIRAELDAGNLLAH